MGVHKILILFQIILATFQLQAPSVNGKGVDIGRMHSFMHGVKGYVTILDENTIEISGMTYDGEGPGSWFVVGKGDDYTKEWVDLDHTVIPDERNRCTQIRRYSGETIKLRVPGKLSNWDYLAIYCIKFNHNFGYIGFPENAKIPAPKKGAEKHEVEACEDVEHIDGEVNRAPSCSPWPACWTKPDANDEEDEDSEEEERKRSKPLAL